MHGVEILLLFVLAALGEGTNSSQFRNRNSSWIEGGHVAAPGEFPFHVLLKMKQGDYCSGSIISRWYIVTAAHCVAGVPESEVAVIAGTNHIDGDGKWYDVARIIVHEGYNPPPINNDIALLKLMEPIVFGPAAQFIHLPYPDERIAIGRECMFSGWGSVSGSEMTTPNYLQKILLIILPGRICKHFFSHFDHGMICAGGAPGRTACKGDSGAPLICGNKLVGVLGGSKEEGVCGDEFPLIYTYVARYAEWIMRHAAI